MISYYKGLEKAFNLPTKDDFKFCDYTTYGLGGGAERAFFPSSIAQAKRAYDECIKSSKPFCVVGNGSNILASESRYRGNVIVTKRMKGIIRLSGDKIFCLSGTTFPQLFAYCKRNGVGAAEFMYGIPATVGGAAYMNAGIAEANFGECIDCVWIYDGKLRKFSQKECNFAYKHSNMRDINAIILAIIVRVSPINSTAFCERLDYYKTRREHLPKGRSCGCVFKNPAGVSAGMLIESAGLKGFSIGGAYVSCEHANFIINRGGSASDVAEVIWFVKSAVYKKFGVMLAEEVVYIGDSHDTYG